MDNKQVEFCGCGQVKGHKQPCLSFKFDKPKDRIGKYSGKSKTPYGGYEKR